MNLLEQDVVAFLATSVVVVPLCKQINVSPVLGFLTAGLALGPFGLGLLKDLSDLNTLGEIGILFLLFEQGLELSVERLKSLAKYAFGLGTLQVALTTMAFTAVPFVGGLHFLENFLHANPALIEMRRLDEAFVIGAALSLSSSAFVLKILQEKRQLGEQFGRASLGVLLMQDIAVVPVLVLLPIVELGKFGASGAAAAAGAAGAVAATSGSADLAIYFAKAMAGLAGLLAFGKFALPTVFSTVAGSRSRCAPVARASAATRSGRGRGRVCGRARACMCVCGLRGSGLCRAAAGERGGGTG
jgi:Kef-type K+ transport system membrane component KefB